MLFSSTIFIFIFLPGVILVNFLLRHSRKAQNTFLCLASLFFYAWGEPKFVIIMMCSIVANWVFGILVDRYRERKNLARIFLVMAILVNLAILSIFKYLSFILENVQLVFNLQHLHIPDIVLPIGISFFTFQALSYVVDVYRDDAKVQHNIINVALYISLFPQLIAGPIVRYTTIADQIENRVENFETMSQGISRFIIGLGKKVLIANNMAVVADFAFDTVGNNSMLLAWLGAIAYTLQIYFDFGGYSDMAIGLGRMFGFEFLENFNYPYVASSITDFWRRWHISMGTWFRDYVYFPLGGNRTKSKMRHIFNMFAVWLCTGIWHGANWTYIAWGLMFFMLLTFEKYSPFDIVKGESFKWLKHIYTMFFIVCGFVVFRANSLTDAGRYFADMFSVNHGICCDGFVEYGTQYMSYFILAVVCCLPIIPNIKKRYRDNIALNVLASIALILILVFSVSCIVKSSYNPFIYFNF